MCADRIVKEESAEEEGKVHGEEKVEAGGSDPGLTMCAGRIVKEESAEEEGKVQGKEKVEGGGSDPVAANAQDATDAQDAVVDSDAAHPFDAVNSGMLPLSHFRRRVRESQIEESKAPGGPLPRKCLRTKGIPREKPE